MSACEEVHVNDDEEVHSFPSCKSRYGFFFIMQLQVTFVDVKKSLKCNFMGIIVGIKCQQTVQCCSVVSRLPF